MDLISALPVFNLYNRDWPIYSQQLNSPPAKFVRDAGADAADVDRLDRRRSAASSPGARIERSVARPWCTVESGAKVFDSVLFERVHVGADAVVRRAILDKDVVVGPGAQIGVDHDADRARGFTVTDIRHHGRRQGRRTKIMRTRGRPAMARFLVVLDVDSTLIERRGHRAARRAAGADAERQSPPSPSAR